MSKFKKGDRVIGTVDDEFREAGDHGTVDQDGSSIPFVKWDNGFRKAEQEYRLIPEEKTMDNLQYGDILIYGESKEEFKVLAVLDQGEPLVFISYGDDFDKVSIFYTVTELKECGYKLKDQKEPIKMTVAEVAKKLGYDVEILKK